MTWIQPILICAIIFGAIYKTIELFVCRKERLTLIEHLMKVGSIEFKGLPFRLYNSGSMFRFTSLRIGCLLCGIGLGLLVGSFLSVNEYIYGENISYSLESTCYTACVCLFGGAALLVSYIVEHQQAKRDRQQENDTEE